MVSPQTASEAASPSESGDPVLSALYDNNSDPRNQADLRTLQQLSAQALTDPTLHVELWRWGASEHDWVHCFKPSRSAEPLPALIFVHGGRWQLNTSAETSFWARTCVQQHWAMVSINFGPLSDTFRLCDQIAAVAAALDAIRRGSDQLNLDRGRLAVAGHSSGAHLALAACLSQQRTLNDAHPSIDGPSVNPSWRALLLVGGLYDLEPLARTRFQSSLKFSQAEVSSCSPLHELTQNRRQSLPAVMVAVGEHETSEFRRQSHRLYEVMSAAGPASWYEVPGTAHFDTPLEFNQPVSLMRTFVSRHLGDRQ